MPAIVSPMTAVHEHVHQWAGQQQQERQCPKEVGAVFAQQKVRSDCTKHEQAEGISGAPKRWCAVRVGPLSRLL